MIIIKSPQEIQIMREAGKMVAECHAILAERVKPGVTTGELDQIIEKHIRKLGGVPSFKGHMGFPATICVAINDVICHGFPGPRELRAGEVVTIDIGALYKGYHADSAWSYAVGEVSPEIQQLMKVTKECLYRGIAMARPGNRTGDIGNAIQTYAESFHYGVVREFCGHGVGRSLWEAPEIPHYGRPNRGPSLQAGITIAIEPMITLGAWKAKLDRDGWTARTVDGSICVQYEHTLAVTEDEPIIITTL
ncbi:methionine aminopeptidase, type I [Desulforamulus reducens MI-1]|uniref:Methionine aminopeptidase n=1 Tax=Desulforamulus reducens (strain ATCC BAA-1160 / DSM 100696 / MI-1) TaxID=349161 RepID=A4J4W7_DESRM|nr:type I methionyl aminopeptidase [Desulforamulus reducens]ABO50120.1 methionine aminopeptidase, type I [Desulforamulus reducens MI-1]